MTERKGELAGDGRMPALPERTLRAHPALGHAGRGSGGARSRYGAPRSSAKRGELPSPPARLLTRRGAWRSLCWAAALAWAAVSPPASAGAGGFQLAVPPFRFQFPRDHAAHPEYQTEWWYYTGHLGSGRRRFGYELTFFQVGIDPSRRRSRSAWALHALDFAHFTLTDENGRHFQFSEQVSRPALGMAGSETRRYHVWVHDWSAILAADGRTHRLTAALPEGSIQLDLRSLKPPVIHGSGGVSQKSPGRGHASHYYSLTRMETRGTLTFHGERLPVSGLSWMDHEFGSNQLEPDEVGWDWFSIQLEDRRELMLYALRLKDGGVEPLSSGTLVLPDGTWKHLPLTSYRIQRLGTWTSPHTHAVYPARWRVSVPGEHLDLTVTPTVPDQEIRVPGTGSTYWEGSVAVTGMGGSAVRGSGYVELTGYAGPAPGI